MTMTIEVTTEDGASVLCMGMPKGNAIGTAFVAAMHGALDLALSRQSRALVLASRGRAFSGGLDLEEAVALRGEGLAAFVSAFDDLFERLFSLDVPVLAAVGGHAIAGGAILALSADWRIMAPGDRGGTLGVTEAALGLALPAAAFEIVASATPERARARVMLEGARLSPEEALSLGLVHDLAFDPLARALDKARAFAALPSEGLRRIKADLRADARARIAARKIESRERFVEVWSSPEAQAKLAAVLEGLSASRRPGRA